GFFNLGNHLAGFLELGLFPALGVALFGRVKTLVRLLLALVVIAGLLGIVLSTSRGGAVATVVGLGAFVMMVLVVTAGRLKWKKIKVGLAVGVLGMLVLGGVGSFGKQVFAESFEGGLTEQKGFRFSAWEMALEQSALAPVLGTGARTYEVYSRKFMPDSIVFLGNHAGLDAEFAHNDYLQLLAEYGLVGLVLLVVAMVAVAWSALRYLWWFRRNVYGETGRASSTRLGVVLGSCGALAALAAHSVLDFNMHVSVNALVAATLVGFLANPGVRREEGGEGRRKMSVGRPLLVLMAAVCGVWVLWVGVPMFRAEILIRKGQMLARSESFLQAVGAYEKALELDPKNYMGYHYRGASFVMLADGTEIKQLARNYYVQAIEEFHRSRTLHPHNVYLLLSLGDALSELRAEQSAEEIYRETIEWAPNHRRVWQRYGAHLLRVGRLEEAKEALERALALEWYGSEPAQVKRWLKVIDQQLAREVAE
ncbi:MAG: O-antigen ligase family protein, partial [Verrucomicrobiales bacterium]|nr:O-antigen ligase family protein [Verrucomicrobiales bacterium]